jgi:hypothetical protein
MAHFGHIYIYTATAKALSGIVIVAARENQKSI